MSKWIRLNFNEIAESTALRIFGSLIAITHVATWFWWSYEIPLSERLKNEVDCWPFFSACGVWRPFLLEVVDPLQSLYLCLAIVTALLFWKQTAIKIALLGLFLLTALKLFVYFQDYRLMGNYHYIPNLVTLVYFFIPHKVWTLQRLLVLIYLFAGSLKLNKEWLSGSALFRITILPLEFIPVASMLAVLFELGLVLLLLSPHGFLFWTALLSCFAFHAFSWHIVGFFYPVVMFSMLGVFLLPRWRRAPPLNLNSLGAKKVSMAFLVAFSLAQLPQWLLSKDASLTGEGRMLALNMFDSNSRCAPFVLIQSDNRWLDVSRKRDDLGVRIHCDPIIHLGEAKKYCPGQITLGLISRRQSDLNLFLVARAENICDSQIRFDAFGKNDWIIETPN